MTRPFPSTVLVGLVLLLAVVGGWISYCNQRREVEQEAPPTPVVIVLPAQPAASPTLTPTPYAPFLTEPIRTPLSTSTPTVAPSATPVPEPTTTRVPQTPTQKG